MKKIEMTWYENFLATMVNPTTPTTTLSRYALAKCLNGYYTMRPPNRWEELGHSLTELRQKLGKNES